MSLYIELDDVLGRYQHYLEAAPDLFNQAAAMALNRVAERDGMKILVKEIEETVNFPEGYVEPRIRVGRKAYANHLEVALIARHRPTSLARFAKGQTPGGPGSRGKPVRLSIYKGRQVETRGNAFLMRLRAGKGLSDENFNIGLAVRLKKGERMRNKREAVVMEGGLALLYGPSVDQVMRGAAPAVMPQILDAVENEFLRQFNRLSEKF